jgi:hypothetical protein
MKKIARVDLRHQYLCALMGDVFQSRGFVTKKTTVMMVLTNGIAQFLVSHMRIRLTTNCRCQCKGGARRGGGDYVL